MSSERKLEPPVPSTLVSISWRRERLTSEACGVGRVAGRVLVAVRLGDLHGLGLLLEGDRVDRGRAVSRSDRDELVVGRRLLRGRRTDQPLREEREHDHDQDRERGAAEEPSHLVYLHEGFRPQLRAADQRTRAQIGGFASRLTVLQRGDVAEVAVPLGVIEPVADREAVRDLEADVADRQIDPPALGLGQQRADLERARVAGAAGS